MKSETIPIVYEDDEILVINKRRGLAVQGGAGVSHSVDGDLAAQTGRKVYLVHRLDKETEGLLVCAKSPAAAAKWTRLVGEKSVTKEYRALCFGEPGARRGRILSAIEERGVKRRAETFYEAEGVFVLPLEDGAEALKVSLLRLRLGTGRTHQLRIHLAGEGLPICGDDRHGDFAANRLLRRAAGIRRLCLSACRLTLPLAGGPRVFEAEADFLPLLEGFARAGAEGVPPPLNN